MINKKYLSLIIQKITGLSKGQLFLNPNINPKYQKKITNDINRLKNGEPLEYIINNAEFYSLDFYVDNRVLIPRNDTEIMVNQAIEEILFISEQLNTNFNITLIDIGTGSSCIPISILKNTNKINHSYVVDISKNALEISKKNIIKHKLEKKIIQINGDLLKNFIGSSEYILDKIIIITANLPYIKNYDFNNIDNETIKFEPALALYGGPKTGFELYEQLIKESIQFKNINNIKTLILFIEIGFDQKEYCEKYLNNLKLKYKIFKDNSNIDRCVKIEF